MKHLALAVSDQQRSRSFYETYFGFDAQPAQRYDDGVLMLFNRDGFSLALGETDESIRLPRFLHFGIGLRTPDDVHAFRRRLADDGVKCSDPDGYVVEAAWEPDRRSPIADT